MTSIICAKRCAGTNNNLGTSLPHARLPIVADSQMNGHSSLHPRVPLRVKFHRQIKGLVTEGEHDAQNENRSDRSYGDGQYRVTGVGSDGAVARSVRLGPIL
jgi:hypothetical protein